MSEKDAYDHQTEVAGGGSGKSDMTEHRDTARPTEQETNELRPETRQEQDGYGPRTHPSTQTTRKSD